MKLRAAVLAVLAALGLGLVVFASPARPAWACSCVALTPAQEDERADLIVVGTVTGVTDRAVRLAVESVEKGDPGSGATLRLAVRPDEDTCGYAFRTGARYRVHSSDGATGLCAGIRALTADPTGAAATAPVSSPTRWWIPVGALLTVVAAGAVAVAVRRRRRSG
ncbi:hypothetical protein [Micromonospora endolithica]|uniref:Tissue inhibitor of metalloproteinase n=1 Tax=Micromonospora endolithica TaxID=230091 RepID=A0A3A9Z128_9ACTN|nr:hypothetical protein [Micromonospora endolithica]RKN42081.1 hypothetical protein D7223_23350 [Micromonospora endolithica]